MRDAYEKLGILKFESLKDSVEEPGVVPPQELVERLLNFLSAEERAALP